MKTKLPTIREIDELTAFLPKLYSEGFSPFKTKGGVEKNKDGSFTISYPTYNRVVDDFFRLASSECWDDHEYIPDQAGEMLGNENLVKNASLSQIKTMLTFCVRGERFCDGHWGAMIEGGQIRRLLERLIELRAEQ
jgi:hypothetical protein